MILLVKEINFADRKNKARSAIADTFHAECPENSGPSGYALLHGTDRTVGDFKIIGWADVQDAIDAGDGAYEIERDLRLVFNDPKSAATNNNLKWLYGGCTRART